MLVSIIIPTYNRVDYLKETLQSVVSQTYQDIEILLMDDGSTEDIEGVAEDFGDNRIHFHREEHTGMPAVLLNKGIGISKGAGVIGLGSDDNMLPDCIEKLVARFSANPDCVLAFADVWLIDKDGKRTGRLIDQLRIRPVATAGKKNYLHTMLRDNCVIGTTAIIRKSVLCRIGFFSEEPMLRVTTDYHMFIRLANEGFWEYIEEPLGEFRQHQTQMSGGWKSTQPCIDMLNIMMNDFTGKDERACINDHFAFLYKCRSRMKLRTDDEKGVVSDWWTYCRKSGKPWLFPAVFPTLIRWRRKREKGIQEFD